MPETYREIYCEKFKIKKNFLKFIWIFEGRGPGIADEVDRDMMDVIGMHIVED